MGVGLHTVTQYQAATTRSASKTAARIQWLLLRTVSSIATPLPLGIADAPYRDPLGPRVRLVTPAARLSSIDRWFEGGCSMTLRREPPIRTLAPRPGPNA